MDATANNALDAGVATNSHVAITPEIETFLNEIRKWARFIAIMGFIMCGLLVLGGLFFGTFMAALPSGLAGAYPGGAGTIMTVVYIAMAVVYFFPFLYLFRFANHMQTALNQHDQYALSDAFENLKSHYKFIGIFIIVMIAIYALLIIAGIGVGIMSSSM